MTPMLEEETLRRTRVFHLLCEERFTVTVTTCARKLDSEVNSTSIRVRLIQHGSRPIIPTHLCQPRSPIKASLLAHIWPISL